MPLQATLYAISALSHAELTGATRSVINRYEPAFVLWKEVFKVLRRLGDSR